jgi:serine/threonine protein phosphatase PrpC
MHKILSSEIDAELMTQFLSEPKNRSESVKGINRVKIDHDRTQHGTLYTCKKPNLRTKSHNGRPKMEDFTKLKRYMYKDKEILFAGLYDGHGGYDVANKAKKGLHREVYNRLEAIIRSLEKGRFKDVKSELKLAFLSFDADIVDADEAYYRLPKYKSGSTATVAIAYNGKVITANIGDSPAYLIYPDGTIKAVFSKHCYENEEERARVRAHGGYFLNNRLDGNLAMTRAFGDSSVDPAKDYLSASPDVFINDIVPGMILVMMSDGVSDELDEDAIARTVLNCVQEENIAFEVCFQAWKKNGTDNMSAVALRFSGE